MLLYYLRGAPPTRRSLKSGSVDVRNTHITFLQELGRYLVLFIDYTLYFRLFFTGICDYTKYANKQYYKIEFGLLFSASESTIGLGLPLILIGPVGALVLYRTRRRTIITI